MKPAMGLTSPPQALSNPTGLGSHAVVIPAPPAPLQSPPGALAAVASGRPAGTASPHLEAWPDALSLLPSRTGGLGLFAARPLRAGVRLLADPPLLALPAGHATDLPDLAAALAALPPAARAAFDALARPASPARDAALAARLAARGVPEHDIEPLVRAAAVFLANAFNVAGGRRALFPTVARLNHSCAPTAHAVFIPGGDGHGAEGGRGERGGHMRVTALRDLPRGAELTLAYFGVLAPRSKRQARAADWGFECACDVCGASSPSSPTSPISPSSADADDEEDDEESGAQSELERRRTRLASLTAPHADASRGPVASGLAGALAAVRALDAAVALCRAEDALVGYLPRALDAAAGARLAALNYTDDGAGEEMVRAAGEGLREAAAVEARIAGADSPDGVARAEKARAVEAVVAALRGGGHDG